VTDEIRLDPATAHRIEGEIAAMAEALQTERGKLDRRVGQLWAAAGPAWPRSSTAPAGTSGAQAALRRPDPRAAFADRGRELATRLAAALGDRYSVRYSWTASEWVQLS
jgi:hypothetical protein